MGVDEVPGAELVPVGEDEVGLTVDAGALEEGAAEPGLGIARLVPVVYWLKGGYGELTGIESSMGLTRRKRIPMHMLWDQL